MYVLGGRILKISHPTKNIYIFYKNNIKIIISILWKFERVDTDFLSFFFFQMTNNNLNYKKIHGTNIYKQQ